jgi:hypothetical protein
MEHKIDLEHRALPSKDATTMPPRLATCYAKLQHNLPPPTPSLEPMLPTSNDDSKFKDMEDDTKE